jgi:hypothetical protein
MATVDPRARVATWPSVEATASRVRYMETPVEATIAGFARLKSLFKELVAPGHASFEVDGNEAQPIGDAVAELDQPLALPRLGCGFIDLEDT